MTPARRRRTKGPDRVPGPDERVLQLLLFLLDARGPVSRAAIFDAISAYRTSNPAAGDRKFERDKKDLREVGVPIEETQAGSGLYQVDARQYQMPAVQLDDDERAALVLAAETLRRWQGLAYRDLVEDALRKLSFDGEMVGRARVPGYLAIALPAKSKARASRSTLAALDGAIARRKVVTLTYASADGALTERRLSPYALVYAGGDWQLIGHCHLRDAPRTFRVDRIRRLKEAGKPGSPDFERPANWSVAAYVQRSPWVFAAGQSGATAVTIDVGPERAWVADEDFGPGALRQPVPAEPGWTRIRFTTGNPDYVITRVLDGVGHLRLVGPETLRQQVRRVAEDVAALYGSEGGA